MFNYVPNILTLTRILAIPCILLSFYSNNIFGYRLSATIFAIACATDFLDGYIARKFNAQSSIGVILDPLADKLIITSTLLMLVKHRYVNELPCLLIFMREFIVSSLREFLSLVKVKLPVLKIGKVKTVLQAIAVFLILLGSKGSGIDCVDRVGEIVLWITSIFTIFTGYFYMRESIKILLNKNI